MRKGQKQFEVELKWVGKGKKPKYATLDYGFETNPPIVINANNKKNALKKLKLPKTVKVKRIIRV